eukprot:394551_1
MQTFYSFNMGNRNSRNKDTKKELNKESNLAPLKPANDSNKFGKDTFIISGYIRSIQRLLGDQQLIPNSLYDLCYSFYHITLPIIAWIRTTDNNQTKKQYRNFGILDIENNKISIINLNKYANLTKKENKSIYFSTLCHIPNISVSLSNDMTDGQRLDGILAAESTQDIFAFGDQIPSYAHLYLFMYKPYYDNVTVEYEYKSNKRIKFECFNDFLYCSDKNILIYEHYKKLYQLDLNHQITFSDFTNFTLLPQNDYPFKTRYFMNQTEFSDEYLHLTYMNNHESIFALSCCYQTFENCTWYSRCEPCETQCGIYNMNNNNWTVIKPFKYSKMPNNLMSFYNSSTCYDSNDDCIYVYSHCIDTADEMKTAQRYDSHKDKWEEISDKNKAWFGGLWTNGEILLGYDRWVHGNGKLTTYRLDLRDNTKKWMTEEIEFQGISRDESQWFRFFA